MIRLFSLVFVLLIGIMGDLFAVHLFPKWDRITVRIETNGFEGTGFLLHYKERTFIVTNKHVAILGKSVISIRIKKTIKDSRGIEHDTVVVDTTTPIKEVYFSDSDYDLLIIHATNATRKYFDVTRIPESLIGDDSLIVPGREVFFLGYPGKLSGNELIVPLVRRGIIAGEKGPLIFIDGNIFGGSSGSPLFLDTDIENNIINNHFIGVVSAEATMERKTKIDSLRFRENMGIGIAIKASYIKTVIANWILAQSSK